MNQSQPSIKQDPLMINKDETQVKDQTPQQLSVHNIKEDIKSTEIQPTQTIQDIVSDNSELLIDAREEKTNIKYNSNVSITDLPEDSNMQIENQTKQPLFSEPEQNSPSAKTQEVEKNKVNNTVTDHIINEDEFPSFWDIIHEKRGLEAIEKVCKRRFKDKNAIKKSLYDIYEKFLNILYEKYHPKLRNIENDNMISLKANYTKLLNKLNREIAFLEGLELSNVQENNLTKEKEEVQVSLNEEDKAFIYSQSVGTLKYAEYATLVTSLDKIELAIGHMQKVNRYLLEKEKDYASKYYHQQIRETELL